MNKEQFDTKQGQVQHSGITFLRHNLEFPIWISGISGPFWLTFAFAFWIKRLTERSGPFALYITQTHTQTDAITHTWRQLKREQWFIQNGYQTQTQTQTETQTRTLRRHFTEPTSPTEDVKRCHVE